jgi:hypothetical protein
MTPPFFSTSAKALHMGRRSNPIQPKTKEETSVLWAGSRRRVTHLVEDFVT